ncbi:4-coumarate-CoA ligase-like protein [Xylogone sp. PMI_703]|nr:4-coumarate-CoA ligase-like protein [Xylogone sp. PMI_703]
MDHSENVRRDNLVSSNMTYFKAQSVVNIPTKDLLSWIFEDQKYDQDLPIWHDATNLARTISSRQARKLIQQLIAGFHAVGFKPGDCICVHSFNDIYYSIIFLAIIGAGGVFTGTNPAYTTYELTHHLQTAEAKFVISEPEIIGNMLEAGEKCGIQRENIFIFNVLGQTIQPGFRSWEYLLQHGERDWVKFDSEEISRATTAARMFSSGTTGLPKAAMISHYNFIAEHTLSMEIYEPKAYSIRRLHALPEFHMAAVPSVHVAPLRGGHTAYVMRRFELEPYLSYLEKYQITELLIVPPLVLAIIMSPLSKQYNLKSIKHTSVGAAPLDKIAQASFKALLAPEAKVTQVWGMTESTCIVTMFPPDEDDTTASIGRFVPNMEAMLIDDDGNNITAYDVQGEVCIRGPCVISGYFKNPAANASSFTPDGWFKTGDVVYCDGRTKKWYIVDRKKELLKVRGFQVAPLEIEGVLLTHPGIAEVAVIGVRLSNIESDSELPRAYVVRRPEIGDNLAESEVKEYVAKKLAKYKNLDGGVRFIDAIPKNTTGKPMKNVLRKEAKAEITASRSRL